MNKKRTMQCSSLFHGVEKLRCMSEIWHHKIQQRLSLDVPPRFNPVKANSCDTGDLPHVTQPFVRRPSCMSDRRQQVFRPKSGLVVALCYTPEINKNNTHNS